MERDKGRRPVTKTMNASPEFVDLVVTLARARGVTVRAFCDECVAPKLAPEYRAHLKASLRKAGDK